MDTEHGQEFCSPGGAAGGSSEQLQGEGWRSRSKVDSGAHTEISPPETLFDTVFP